MRSEIDTPADQRYLMLCDQLSPALFEQERNAVLSWCSENEHKLEASNRRALEVLSTSSLATNARAFIVAYCYADVPTGRAYDLAFNLQTMRPESVSATLQFGIFWSRLPVQTLEHGHTQVAFFNFSGDIPPTIERLPVAGERRASQPSIALCNTSDWEQIQIARAVANSRGGNDH